MLVIARKKNESIVINNDIVITVLEIRGDKVRLGIVAPKEVPVHREEVYEGILGMSNLKPAFCGSLNPPYSLMALDPEWRTSTVIALAQGIFASRDFSAMPILADALQDAGCDNDDILNHCRNAGMENVRGSWVIDLILGKS